MRSNISLSGITLLFLAIDAMGHGGNSGAGNATGDPCAQIMQDAQQAFSSVNYTNPNLSFFHQIVAQTNGMGTAPATQALCEFVQNMGMDPTLSSLPQTLTKTMTDGQGNSHTVVLTVTSPSESFATTNGYTAKATVTYDGTQFMGLWWEGTGGSSKGYMIAGNQPLMEDAFTHLFYAQWDRTSAQQFVKVWSTQFQTSYLTTATAPGGSTSIFGDMAQYANINFNTGTNAATLQWVQIQQLLGQKSSSTFGCYRLMATGTIGGTLDLYFSHLGMANPPSLYDPVNQTLAAGANDLDSTTNITDSTSTAAVPGSPVVLNNAGNASAPSAFDHSCNDLSTAAQTGNPFASGTVSYATDPSTVFP